MITQVDPDLTGGNALSKRVGQNSSRDGVQDAIFADIQGAVLPRRDRGGAGVAVPAAVPGAPVGPVRDHPPAAVAAQENTDQSVVTGYAVRRLRECVDVLSGNEVGFGDQRRAGGTIPFTDPGELARAAAKSRLQDTRNQVKSAGGAATTKVGAARDKAPKQPGVWSKVGDFFSDVGADLEKRGRPRDQRCRVARQRRDPSPG